MASSPPSSRSPSPRTARKASSATASTTGRPAPVGRKRLDPRRMDAMEICMEIIELVKEGDVEEVKEFDSRLRRMGNGLAQAMDEARQMSVQGGQVSSRDPSDSLLHIAAERGHFEIFEYLADEIQININSIGREGDTPLMRAIAGTYPAPIVKFLVTRGASLNVGNQNALTALHIAVSRDLINVAKLLLTSGAEVDPVSQLGTPLQIAVQQCGPDLVWLLLSRGANGTIRGSNGHTLLHLATMNGNYKTVEGLLSRNIAPVDALCQNGTALHIAAKSGNLEMVKLLIENYASTNIADTDALMPLEVAASHGERECVEYLFELTARLHKYADWSVDGIIEHIKSEKLKLRAQEDSALEEKDCAATSSTEAMKAFTCESTLLEKDCDESVDEVMHEMRLSYGGEVPRKETS